MPTSCHHFPSLMATLEQTRTQFSCGKQSLAKPSSVAICNLVNMYHFMSLYIFSFEKKVTKICVCVLGNGLKCSRTEHL